MPAGGFEDGARQFGDLARNLRLVGSDELRRELYKAINEASKPVADEIRSLANLEDHMPNRYAAVLRGGLQVTTHKRTAVAEPGVTIMARAPTPRGGRGRQVRFLDAGLIRHPVYAQGPRRDWRWETQEGGMAAGFFTDPCQRAAPRIRDAIAAAVVRVEEKATRGIG